MIASGCHPVRIVDCNRLPKVVVADFRWEVQLKVSTGSFFHDRSTTLGTLMGVTFPAITFRAPSQHQESNAAAAGGVSAAANAVGGGARRRSNKAKKTAALVAVAERRRRRWWRLCRDEDSRPSSLGEFLEVERRFGDGAFYCATAEIEGAIGAQPPDRRLLFADGRVLPPPPAEDAPPSTAGALCRFPVSLTGICSGGVG
ncbi:hypothetical protein TEA_009572 [Camellia sinensis var. sinensis]|uniref:Uncharacterized protein n=1 Tax=Camellia sinensis var. sinensis TaxID=542762 RepID=A0A4S4DYF7_CAMSN|nr:hypothetical protein TEA_009572 [Camellia sinensis var. sinensis]